MSEKQEMKAVLEKASADLSALIESAQVKLKLASMETKDAASKVGVALDNMRGRVVELGQRWRDTPALSDDERLQLHLMQMEIRERLSALEPTLHILARDVKDAVASLPVEAARLEASLASMEAKDAIDRRMAAAKRELQDASRAITDAVDGLAKRAAELRAKLTSK